MLAPFRPVLGLFVRFYSPIKYVNANAYLCEVGLGELREIGVRVGEVVTRHQFVSAVFFCDCLLVIKRGVRLLLI